MARRKSSRLEGAEVRTMRLAISISKVLPLAPLLRPSQTRVSKGMKREIVKKIYFHYNKNADHKYPKNFQNNSAN
jgi:hypothetical protein